MSGLDIFNKTITIQDLQKRAPSIVNEIAAKGQEKIIIHENQPKAVLIPASMYDKYMKFLETGKVEGNRTPPAKQPVNTSQTNTPKHIYDYNSTLNEIAKEAFNYLEEHQLLTNDHLYNLCNGLYCHDMFNMSYPLLKRVHNKILLSTEIMIDNQVRYWKQMYTFNNKFYVLYSLLYDKNKALFIDWFDRNFSD